MPTSRHQTYRRHKTKYTPSNYFLFLLGKSIKKTLLLVPVIVVLLLLYLVETCFSCGDAACLLERRFMALLEGGSIPFTITGEGWAFFINRAAYFSEINPQNVRERMFRLYIL